MSELTANVTLMESPGKSAFRPNEIKVFIATAAHEKRDGSGYIRCANVYNSSFTQLILLSTKTLNCPCFVIHG